MREKPAPPWRPCRGSRLSQSSIRLEIHAPFGEIILNKPGKRNALSVDMWAAIPELMQQIVAADDVDL